MKTRLIKCWGTIQNIYHHPAYSIVILKRLISGGFFMFKRASFRLATILINRFRQISTRFLPEKQKDPRVRAAATKKYYVEDWIRVYPESIVFDNKGKICQPTKNSINNYLNHRKFYIFASQFVLAKRVLDAGCGSGYGCEIIHQNGASYVSGCDVSQAAIKFARQRYSNIARFSLQGITHMPKYQTNTFDVSISSEVLEHVKEYGVEYKTIEELKRVTKLGGLVIIGTPNSELLGSHGFSFDELNRLFGKYFVKYCVFENALVPYGENKRCWEKRLSEGKIGVVVSQNINLSETVLFDDIKPQLKKGIDVGRYKFDKLVIDTSLLHNTHSWIIIAVNDK